MPVIAERLEKIAGISLKSGFHSQDSAFCVMEAVAFVAGEKWSAFPECTCPVIGEFMRAWNDGLPSDADRDRLLKPLIPRLVGTRNKALEEKRSLVAADWLVRTHIVAWLRLAKLDSQADLLAALPEIINMEQIPSIRGPLEAIRKAAAAAGAASGAAGWDATWAAAWAAAGAAAGAASGAAGWDATWAAAWAAAGAAAWAAAAAGAGAALKGTTDYLQQSALELVNRMIDAKE